MGFVERELDPVSEAPSPHGAEAVAYSYPTHPSVKALGVAEPCRPRKTSSATSCATSAAVSLSPRTAVATGIVDPPDLSDDGLSRGGVSRKDAPVL